MDLRSLLPTLRRSRRSPAASRTAREGRTPELPRHSRRRTDRTRWRSRRLGGYRFYLRARRSSRWVAATPEKVRLRLAPRRWRRPRRLRHMRTRSTRTLTSEGWPRRWPRRGSRRRGRNRRRRRSRRAAPSGCLRQRRRHHRRRTPRRRRGNRHPPPRSKAESTPRWKACPWTIRRSCSRSRARRRGRRRGLLLWRWPRRPSQCRPQRRITLNLSRLRRRRQKKRRDPRPRKTTRRKPPLSSHGTPLPRAHPLQGRRPDRASSNIRWTF
mmetsp:Transcript_81598/g.197759  ORF Transcript_81598/g.197759 Transcript_81598/m.197759 type:complete len:269 (-) Transcript_81598:2998-3804(-)